MITSEDLKHLQKIQLSMMDDIHALCVKHSINYYVIAGTALGAIRHGGFIPWDCDIDIAMMRDDYDKFEEICKCYLPEKYRYLCYKNTNNFPRPHALISLKNTSTKSRYSKFNPNEMDLGIYLDVFPLDKAPCNKQLQEKLEKKLLKIKLLKSFKSNDRWKEESAIRNILRNILSFIVPYSINSLNKKFDRECARYKNEQTELVCSMASHYSFKKQLIPYAIYGTPTLVKFADREYYAPEKIHDYLTKIYGDYMKLPSEEERNIYKQYFEHIEFNKNNKSPKISFDANNG